MREHSTRKCFLITKLRAISVRGCNQRTLRCIGLGTVAGKAFVADLSKKLGTIACPRCEAPMEEVVRIAPAQNGPGLIGYECPSCNYVTSVLTPSKSPRRPQGRPKQSLSEVQEPTHVTFRIDTWTAGGESVIEHVAGAEDCHLLSPLSAPPANAGRALQLRCDKALE